MDDKQQSKQDIFWYCDQKDMVQVSLSCMVNGNMAGEVGQEKGELEGDVNVINKWQK